MAVYHFIFGIGSLLLLSAASAYSYGNVSLAKEGSKTLDVII